MSICRYTGVELEGILFAMNLKLSCTFFLGDLGDSNMLITTRDARLCT